MIEKFAKLSARRRAALAASTLFSGSLGKKQAQQIGRWSDGDRDYQQEFSSVLTLLADMEGLANSDNIRAIVDETVEHNHRRRSQLSLSIAAAIAVVCVIGAMVIGLVPGTQQVELQANVSRYVTRVGEQKQINMADGSVITLNTGSEIIVSISDTKRQIRMEQGEAYFDVAADPNRPFSVNIGSRTVSVIGTEFNIRKNADRFILAVMEGKVALHKPDEKLVASAVPRGGSKEHPLHLDASAQQQLDAGWVAEFDHEKVQLTAYRATNVADLSIWKTGLASFEGASLYKVIQELNRYSGKKILIEDPSIMNLKIYALVEVKNVYAAIDSLEKTQPLKISHYPDRIVITAE